MGVEEGKRGKQIVVKCLNRFPIPKLSVFEKSSLGIGISIC